MTRGSARLSRRDHEHVDRISTQTTIFVLVIIAVLLHAIQWMLLPFVLSGLVAFICTPLVDGLSKRTGWPRSAWAACVFVIIVGIGVIMGFLGVPPLIRELAHLVTDFQSIIENLAKTMIGDRTVSIFGQSMNASQLAQAAVSGVNEWIGEAGRLVVFGGFAFAGFFSVFLTIVLFFYFIMSGPAIMRGLLWMVPPKQRPFIQHIWSRLDPVLRRYFIGVLVVVVYAIVASYIGLGLVLGIHHAVVLALLTGILEMIPIVGPGAAAVIAGLVAVRYATGIGSIIAYAIYATVLRLSIDQLLGPIALGTAARLHPVLIIFCFLSGGLLFGITGVIMAAPVALVTKVTLAALYDEPQTQDDSKPAKADG
ncbi:MAG TPA: AI-2E family transporter [Pseudolabrys sp.]|jgi:predicted PurR-regulated permease PerM|nr:AI-2E family transporter [Pseudolabrys sp.]